MKEYNTENDTSYTIAETCVQGSMAMSTVVQNENGDYDIDVAVVFDKSVLGDKGAQATRNLVANALKRKTKQFNAEPEVKTSCVTRCMIVASFKDFFLIIIVEQVFLKFFL